GKTRAQLSRDVERLVGGQTANPAKQRRQILPVDVLHGQEMTAVRQADVVHAADIRMRDLTGDPDLTKEPVEEVGALVDRSRQELERHRVAERQIVSAV